MKKKGGTGQEKTLRYWIGEAREAKKGETRMAKRDIGSEVLEMGVYPAIVVKIEDDQVTAKQGPNAGTTYEVCRWFWLLDNGENMVDLQVLSSRSFGPQSKAGKWARGMLGLDMLPIDFDDRMLIGEPCLVSLGITEKNGYRNNEVLDVSPPELEKNAESYESLEDKYQEFSRVPDSDVKPPF